MTHSLARALRQISPFTLNLSVTLLDSASVIQYEEQFRDFSVADFMNLRSSLSSLLVSTSLSDLSSNDRKSVFYDCIYYCLNLFAPKKRLNLVQPGRNLLYIQIVHVPSGLRNMGFSELRNQCKLKCKSNPGQHCVSVGNSIGDDPLFWEFVNSRNLINVCLLLCRSVARVSVMLNVLSIPLMIFSSLNIALLCLFRHWYMIYLIGFVVNGGLEA